MNITYIAHENNAACGNVITLDYHALFGVLYNFILQGYVGVIFFYGLKKHFCVNH
jgi:hypothetical protein